MKGRDISYSKMPIKCLKLKRDSVKCLVSHTLTVLKHWKSKGVFGAQNTIAMEVKLVQLKT